MNYSIVAFDGLLNTVIKLKTRYEIPTKIHHPRQENRQTNLKYTAYMSEYFLVPLIWRYITAAVSPPPSLVTWTYPCDATWTVRRGDSRSLRRDPGTDSEPIHWSPWVNIPPPWVHIPPLWMHLPPHWRPPSSPLTTSLSSAMGSFGYHAVSRMSGLVESIIWNTKHRLYSTQVDKEWVCRRHDFESTPKFIRTLQALTLAMCPLARMPFWGCRASSGHHNLFFTSPRGQWIFFFFFFFLVLHMPPLFLLGIGKTRKATLIRTYFSLYIGLMYKSVQLHAWNHKFPPR